MQQRNNSLYKEESSDRSTNVAKRVQQMQKYWMNEKYGHCQREDKKQLAIFFSENKRRKSERHNLWFPKRRHGAMHGDSQIECITNAKKSDRERKDNELYERSTSQCCCAVHVCYFFFTKLFIRNETMMALTMIHTEHSSVLNAASFAHCCVCCTWNVFSLSLLFSSFFHTCSLTFSLWLDCFLLLVFLHLVVKLNFFCASLYRITVILTNKLASSRDARL